MGDDELGYEGGDADYWHITQQLSHQTRHYTLGQGHLGQQVGGELGRDQVDVLGILKYDHHWSGGQLSHYERVHCEPGLYMTSLYTCQWYSLTGWYILVMLCAGTEAGLRLVY